MLMRSLEINSSRTKAGIRVVYNEDGLNNGVDPIIVGWMAKNNVPLAMITTIRTPLDAKRRTIRNCNDKRREN